jgi:hypothetical protein
MNFKFLKVVLTASVLSASCFVKLASASPILSTYEWSATCYDCQSTMGERPDEAFWTQVTGSITLRDYTVGDVITDTNFETFSYGGVSLHLPQFTIGADELAEFTLFSVSGTVRADAFLDIDIVANIKDPLSRPHYGEFGDSEDIYYEFLSDREVIWKEIADNEEGCMSDVASGVEHDFDDCVLRTTQPHWRLLADIDTELARLLILIPQEDEAFRIAQDRYGAQVRTINFLSDDVSWSISAGTIYSDRDFGFGLSVTNLPVVVDSVPEPSTLAIFALGLMGLASRRFKKIA